MKSLFVLVLLLAFIAPSDLEAQVKYSNEFLSIGVGARTLGMGGAGISGIDDVTAGYWNPSRLLNVSNRFDGGLMHAEYFAGIAKFDYAGFAYQIDQQSSAGISLIRMGVDDIPNTMELIDSDGNVRYDRITHFSSADLGILLSYARRMPVEGLQLGGSFKVIHRRTGDFASAWGFGLDASVSYTIKNWELAVVGRDITGTFNAWRFNTEDLEEVFDLTGNELPENSLELTIPRIIIGASRSFLVAEKLTASANLDFHFTLDGQRPVLASLGFTGIDPYLGTEWGYNDWIFMRLGIGQFQWVPDLEGGSELTMQPALGIGIRIKGFVIDYALTDLGDVALAPYSNIISLRFGW